MDFTNIVPSFKIDEKREYSQNVEISILVTKYTVTAMCTFTLNKINWKRLGIYTSGIFYRYQDVRNVYYECFSENSIDVTFTKNGQINTQLRIRYLNVKGGSRIVNQVQVVGKFTSVISKSRFVVECCDGRVSLNDILTGVVFFTKNRVMRNGVKCCHISLNINRAFSKKERNLRQTIAWELLLSVYKA